MVKKSELTTNNMVGLYIYINKENLSKTKQKTNVHIFCNEKLTWFYNLLYHSVTVDMIYIENCIKVTYGRITE